MVPIIVEYIWIDGNIEQRPRSKSRVLMCKSSVLTLSDIPHWGFDGSSTNQAVTNKSDCVLVPVLLLKHPFKESGDYICLCEVTDVDMSPNKVNNRAKLCTLINNEILEKYDPYIGFEQEYVMFSCANENSMHADTIVPLGWPTNGAEPPPQGKYYCGVGADRVFYRKMAELHMRTCLDIGLNMCGINAEVMPGQWEYQIGYRGIEHEKNDPLTISDHLWVARWLLCRIGENFNIGVSFSNKVRKGDWNGSGMHTNFSTKQMRRQGSGLDEIHHFVNEMGNSHCQYIEFCGHKVNERLTGRHETSDISEFSCKNFDRSASVRIPCEVYRQKCGYLEDRRPGANADPYLISYGLMLLLK